MHPGQILLLNSNWFDVWQWDGVFGDSVEHIYGNDSGISKVLGGDWAIEVILGAYEGLQLIGILFMKLAQF